LVLGPLNTEQAQDKVDKGHQKVVEPGEHLFTVSVFTRSFTRGYVLGYDTCTALGSLPDLYGPYERVTAFGTRSLLIDVTAMTVGGAEDVVLVEARCLL